MIILNLLPPEKKKNLLAEQGLRLIKSSLIILLASVVLAIGLTLAIRFWLQTELTRLSSEITQLNSQSTEAMGNSGTALIQEINRRAQKISEIQEKYLTWSPFLNQTTSSVSNNIQINSLIFNRTESTFEVQGVAKGRADLLDFKSKLEALTFLNNIKSPISNLIKKENISFQLSSGFNPVEPTSHEDN